MTYQIAFELPGLPDTTNSSRRDGHWSVTAKKRSAWKQQIYYTILELGRPKLPLTRAHLVLTRYSSVEPDYEGLVSTFKGVIDGLILAKVIENDNTRIIGRPDYRWEKTKPGRGKIRIEVMEVVPQQE